MRAARTLLRNGWIVTLDDTLDDIAGGDVLIEDDRIAAVGRTLAAADASVIDASGMLQLRHVRITARRGRT